MSETRNAARAVLLLRDALDLDGSERAAFLDRECGSDAALRAELDSLLSRIGSHSDVLDQPALALAGRLIEDEAASREGDVIGAFRITALLGEGGMGTVYRAERFNADFAQTVALKIIRSSSPNAALRERFRRERAILASLDHPGIARFVDGGVTEAGELWFAMALIDGPSITHYADEHALGIPQRAALLASVCDAVASAHRNLVVHRDIKPSNIVVDAAGAPHLLDFGIAKLLDETGSDATLTDARAMTPHYAAPEQIRGEAVTTATDVYALGVVLFELLTGRRPFGSGTVTPFHVQRAVLEESRPSLVQASATLDQGKDPSVTVHDAAWSKHLRGDLEHIVERAMARELERRYASVAALAEDLRRHLDGRPIRARPDTAGYRATRFVQRNRLGVALATLSVIALLATTAASVVQAQRAERESLRATTAAASARNESTRANAAAASAQRERDAALDESRRQDALREHFVAVLGRASESGTPIAPEALTELASDRRLLGTFKDPEMQRALDLAIVDFLVQRGDYPRVLTMLDEIEPALATASGRHRALAAANRAIAAMRVGNLDDTESAVARADAAMTREQRRGGTLPARLEMVRGQLSRARGELPLAAAAARRAGALALQATDSSALERGAIIGSTAAALLQLGELDAAAEFAAQADSVWKTVGVTTNVSMRNVATVRTNALFLRGELLAALAGMEAINADTSTVESAPSRAARDLTQAKTLALLGRPEEALALVDDAVRGMCAAVGAESLDCLRVRLSSIDTRYLAGQPARARAELTAIAPALAAQPPLAAAAKTFASVLDLLLAPSEATLAPVLDILPASAKAGALPQRNVVRTLLVLAETLDASGNRAFAERLARAAIDTAGDAIDGTGMDPSLLALWRSRLSGTAPDPAALAQLAAAIGDTHPWVAAHRIR